MKTVISAQFFCSDLGYPKLTWFYQKNEWASRKMLYFVNWRNAAPSKIGPSFSNKPISELKLEFFSSNKKWSPELIFFNDKKNLKKNSWFMTLKVWFCHLSTVPHYVNLQNTTFSLKPIIFFDKIKQANFEYPRSE